MLITVENYLPQGSEDEERGEKMEDAEQEQRSRVKMSLSSHTPTTASHLFTYLTLSIVLFVLLDNFISELLACLQSMLLSPKWLCSYLGATNLGPSLCTRCP